MAQLSLNWNHIAERIDGAMEHPNPENPHPPLTDSFGRVHTYLRVSLTDRCNLRCSYCMPPEGIRLKTHDEILRYHEIERLVRLFARMGIRKVRLTGGEPLIRRNVPDLVAGLAKIEGLETLALTTNGILLAEHAPTLRQAGLSRINISLDTLRPERFRQIALVDALPRVCAGIDAALAAGFANLKINVVVMAGVNDDEILDFTEYVRDRSICVRFIEYMPFRSNQWDIRRFVSCDAMRARISERHALAAAESGPVAQVFRIDGFRGTVGFISSMSNHFCGDCNRLRLTADGSLKTCLFFHPEASLRDLLRAGGSDAELMDHIRRTVSQKREGHSAPEDIDIHENQSMLEIGG